MAILNTNSRRDGNKGKPVACLLEFNPETRRFHTVGAAYGFRGLVLGVYYRAHASRTVEATDVQDLVKFWNL